MAGVALKKSYTDMGTIGEKKFHLSKFRARQLEKSNLYFRVTESDSPGLNVKFVDSEFASIQNLAEYSDVFRKLEVLEDDWDAYGSEAPARSAITNARKFILFLGETNFKPDRIAASPEGGVSISYFREKKTFMIEILNSGDVSGVKSDGEGSISAEHFIIEHYDSVSLEPIYQNIDRHLWD